MIQSGDSFIAADDIAVVVDTIPLLKTQELMYVILKAREKSLVPLEFIVENIVPQIKPRCNIMYIESEVDASLGIRMIDVKSIDRYTPIEEGFNVALTKEQFKDQTIHDELKHMLEDMCVCKELRRNTGNYIHIQSDGSPRFTPTLPGYNSLEWSTAVANIFPGTTSDGNPIINIMGILRAMREAKKAVLNERDAEKWAKKFFLTLSNISFLFAAHSHNIGKFETQTGFKFPTLHVGAIHEQYIEVNVAGNCVSVDPQLDLTLSAVCFNWKQYLPQHAFKLNAIKDRELPANTSNQRLAVTPMNENFDLGINIHREVMSAALAKMCEQFLSETPKRTYMLPGDLAGFVVALNDAKAYLKANFAHSSGDSDFFLFDPRGFCNQSIVQEMSKYMVVAQDVSIKGRKGFSTMDGINFLSFDTLERECIALQQLGPVLFITDRSMTDQVAVSITYDSSRREWL